jgi:hypothetical protein
MTHFVSDPEPYDYWMPRISTMSIPAKNGKAKINVWHIGHDEIVLRVESQHPRFAYYPNDRGQPHKSALRRFVVEGLITGDRIAVFKPGEANDDTLRLTSWLLIESVAIDRRARGAALRPSDHMPNIKLDTFGLNSSNYPMDGSEFIKKVNAAILRIKLNHIGNKILSKVLGSGDVIIFFSENNYIKTSVNNYGDSQQMTIALEYKYLLDNKNPGSSLDEVIFHEFAHHADGFADTYKNIGDGLLHDKTDFFSVTVTNVYASIHGRPLRKDHPSFSHMIPRYQGAAGEAKFSNAYKDNFAQVRSAIGSELYHDLVFADAPWNPFP